MSTHACLVFALSAAMTALQSLPAHGQTQAVIIDARGTVIGVPAGRSDHNTLNAYIEVNSETIEVELYPAMRTSTDLDWVTSYRFQWLFFRSSDCSGPALIGDQYGSVLAHGTTPAVIFAEKRHTWLHMAKRDEAESNVDAHSFMDSHHRCATGHERLKTAYRALPAVDLNELFTPPFKVHLN